MDSGSAVEITALDGHAAQHAGRSPQTDQEISDHFDTPLFSRSSPHGSHSVDGLPSLRESLRVQGVQTEGADIILASWGPGTQKQYRTHLTKWSEFCCQRDLNPFTPSAPNIINFLTDSFNRGVGYSSLNMARGALSSLGIVVDGVSAGSHPLVRRFLKGVFNLRPPKPRYTTTWDVQPLLAYLRSLFPLYTLSLKELILKLVMLMALTQAARVQTLHLLLLQGINIEDSSITVPLAANIKQCRPNFNIQCVTFIAYDRDVRLCVYETLCAYVNKTVCFRSNFPRAGDR